MILKYMFRYKKKEKWHSSSSEIFIFTAVNNPSSLQRHVNVKVLFEDVALMILAPVNSSSELGLEMGFTSWDSLHITIIYLSKCQM